MPCDVKCSVCGKCFRRESDKARHRCTAECQKPVQVQEGAVECLMCGRWLRSRGGLAVHRRARQEEGGQTFRFTLEDQTTESLAVRSPARETTRMRGSSMQVENVTVECKEYGRPFRRTRDRKNKCLAERAKPVKEQRGALQYSKCQKWFCSSGGLAMHKCRESREPLTKTTAKDDDSALLLPPV